METWKTFIERSLPDLIIAAAALGVFVLLGAVVLISILFENWFAARKHRPQAATLEGLQLNIASRKSARSNPNFSVPASRDPALQPQQV